MKLEEYQKTSGARKFVSSESLPGVWVLKPSGECQTPEKDGKALQIRTTCNKSSWARSVQIVKFDLFINAS